MDRSFSTVEQAIGRIRQNWPGAADDRLAVIMATNRVSRLLDERMTRALAELGLSNTEFEILAVLRSQPEPHRMLPTQFYEAVLMSSGGVTKVLKALEARQLVSRPANTEDRRSRPIELTAPGKMLAEQGMLALQNALECIFSRFEAKGSAKDLARLLFHLLAETEQDRQRPKQLVPATTREQ